MPSFLSTKGPRTKRGLPRPCQGCGQSFRPKNNKGMFCSEACKKARARRKAQEPQIGTAAIAVARVPFRSKSPNNIKGVSDHFSRPKGAARTGWHIEGGELVYYLMPETPALSENERRVLGGGHKVLKAAIEVTA